MRDCFPFIDRWQTNSHGICKKKSFESSAYNTGVEECSLEI